MNAYNLCVTGSPIPQFISASTASVYSPPVKASRLVEVELKALIISHA
jgi:hypothetical protein